MQSPMSAKSAIIAALSWLPTPTKNAIFHLAFNLAPERFREFAYKYAYAPDMKFGLSLLRDRGFLPKTVIDVGAFEGGWSLLAKQAWPTSNIIMIEPNPSETLQAVAKQLAASVYSCLLGATDDAEVTFYSMRNGSSVFQERSPVPRVTEMRKLRRLDSLRLAVQSPILLKLDTQGYELEILKGGLELLKRCDAVLLEASLIEINESAPLLHDVLGFMSEKGFIAYDIVEFHRRPLDRALNQIDLIFLKRDCELLSDKRHFA